MSNSESEKGAKAMNLKDEILAGESYSLVGGERDRPHLLSRNDGVENYGDAAERQHDRGDQAT